MSGQTHRKQFSSLKGFYFAVPCPSHQLLLAGSAPTSRSLIPHEARKEPSKMSLPFPPESKTLPTRKATHYSWIMNEGWYFLRGTNRRHSPYCWNTNFIFPVCSTRCRAGSPETRASSRDYFSIALLLSHIHYIYSFRQVEMFSQKQSGILA